MRSYKWQAWEISLLCAEYATTGAKSLVRKLPYRTEKAIRTKANELGLQLETKNGSVQSACIEWDTPPTSVDEVWERARILREAREEPDEYQMWHVTECKYPHF